MSADTWRLIDTGFSNAYLNMAIDEVIMLSCKNGTARPTLRFYQWKPSGLSIGYAQKFGDGINLKYCREMGIDIVRRITGGQAVLHDGDLTYSVAIPEDCLEIPKTTNLFKMIGLGLMEGLRNLGVKAHSFNLEEASKENKSYNCFFNRSSYEIAMNGKKLIGSAQRRTSGALLQHGAILIKIDYERMIKVYAGNGESDDERINKFRQRITSLAENMEIIPEACKIKMAIVAGFEKLFGIKFIPEYLSSEEFSEAKKLADEKYSKKKWNELK